MEEIRKPRVKLVPIWPAFRKDGAWRQMFGDRKGRVYRRTRRKGWRETWHLVTTIYERKRDDP